MSVLGMIGLIATAIAVFGYLNNRFLKMPDSVGITGVGLVISVILMITSKYDPDLTDWATSFADRINFTDLVMSGLLPILLFAGSLHVDFKDLRKYTGAVLSLATASVIISTVIVGYGLHYILGFMGIQIGIWYCLVFGALISPTDPIAVLGLLKTAGVPKSLEMKITGEALLNDCTAVVAFLVLLGIATGTSEASLMSVSTHLFREVAGGGVLGCLVGYCALKMLKGIDSYATEILITVAAATGGYSLAQYLHVSGPLAVVIIGLAIGNHGVKNLMSEKTREHLTSFWDLMDEVLNLVLFGLIAIKMISMDTTGLTWGAVAVFVPVVLLARWASVAVPLTGLQHLLRPGKHTTSVLTWGGLRGGISVALAISLPEFQGKDVIVAGTYAVVLFSLLVQGPTLPRLLSKLGLSK